MEKDRHGLDSNVLRFVARLDTTRPIDMDRRFIIFYHLSDDTITVFEPPQRNSGEQPRGGRRTKGRALDQGASGRPRGGRQTKGQAVDQGVGSGSRDLRRGRGCYACTV